MKLVEWSISYFVRNPILERVSPLNLKISWKGLPVKRKKVDIRLRVPEKSRLRRKSGTLVKKKGKGYLQTSDHKD